GSTEWLARYRVRHEKPERHHQPRQDPTRHALDDHFVHRSPHDSHLLPKAGGNMGYLVVACICVATASAPRITLRIFSPATFRTSAAVHPRRSSSAMRSGNFDTSSSPTGTLEIPSKSEPRPTWSTPATCRRCSMSSAT